MNCRQGQADFKSLKKPTRQLRNSQIGIVRQLLMDSLPMLLVESGLLSRSFSRLKALGCFKLVLESRDAGLSYGKSFSDASLTLSLGESLNDSLA